MKKVTVVSPAHHTPTGPPFLSNIIILPVWELLPAQEFGFRGDNYLTKKVRVVSLACHTPTGSPLHSY